MAMGISLRSRDDFVECRSSAALIMRWALAPLPENAPLTERSTNVVAVGCEKGLVQDVAGAMFWLNLGWLIICVHLILRWSQLRPRQRHQDQQKHDDEP